MFGLNTGSQTRNFEALLSTIPLEQLATLMNPLNEEYGKQLKEIQYIGVVCMILELKKPLSPYFWLNINDSRIAFNGIIEYTNLNRKLREQGYNIVYIPFYLPAHEERYAFSDQQLFEEYALRLKYINPDFRESWVKDFRVFRNRFAR